MWPTGQWVWLQRDSGGEDASLDGLQGEGLGPKDLPVGGRGRDGTWREARIFRLNTQVYRQQKNVFKSI